MIARKTTGVGRTTSLRKSDRVHDRTNDDGSSMSPMLYPFTGIGESRLGSAYSIRTNARRNRNALPLYRHPTEVARFCTTTSNCTRRGVHAQCLKRPHAPPTRGSSYVSFNCPLFFCSPTNSWTTFFERSPTNVQMTYIVVPHFSLQEPYYITPAMFTIAFLPSFLMRRFLAFPVIRNLFCVAYATT